MNDRTVPVTRERVWVEKIDRTGEQPVVVEEVLVENGAVVHVRAPQRPLTDEERDAIDAAASRV